MALKMKKTGSKIISVFCCVALLFGFVAYGSGNNVSAASAKTVGLIIEGTNNVLFNGNVELKSGDTACDVIERALDGMGYAKTDSSTETSAKTYYFPNDPTYGLYISRIGAYAGNSSAYWSFYINGGYASSGIGSFKPGEGDTIVVAYGDFSQYYPTVSMTPAPVCGHSYKIQVKGSITTYDANWNAKTSVENIAGATVLFNGGTYTTDSEGCATVAMPSSAGCYDLVVQEKDDASGYAYGLHTVTRVNVMKNETDFSHIDVSSTESLSVPLSVSSSGSEKTAAFANGGSFTVRNGSTDLSLEISAGTVITGSSSWDGRLLLPQVVSKSSVSITNGSCAFALKLGADKVSLSLSKPARIVLPGMSGKRAGYVDADGVFHRITRVLSSDAADEDMGSDDTAFYDNGTDLVIYTTHFSTFAAYTDTSSSAISDKAVASALKSAASVLKSDDASQWAAFALARAGITPKSAYLDEIKSDIAQNGGDYGNPSSLAKAILVLRANGYDPAEFYGVNLIEKLSNYGDIELSGLSGPAYALMVLDAAGSEVPSGAKWTKSKLISIILGYQKSDGGFSFSKDYDSDVDMTAMAVTALSRHTENAAVQKAVDDALSFISSKQNKSGGFTTVYGESSETVSQVMIALCSLGIDPKTDARFVKSGKTTLDCLMTYRVSSGGFEHTQGGGQDSLATEQAAMALCAYTRLNASEVPLYDLSDVTVSKTAGVPKNPDTGSADSPAVPAAIAFAAFALLAPIAKKLNQVK